MELQERILGAKAGEVEEEGLNLTKTTGCVALAVAAALALAWFIWGMNSVWVATRMTDSTADITRAGSWGDSFGPFSALISAIGFAAVVATMVQQIRVFNEQKDDLHRQRFEATYFELLDMLRAARAEVRFRQSEDYRELKSRRKKSEVHIGPDAFRAAMFEFRHWLSTAPQGDPSLTKAELGGLYRKRVHVRYESTFGPYFRLLYTILWRLRDDKKLTAEEKRRYGNLLRGHLTSFEVAMAGFNGLMEQAKDFDSLITEFRLLKYYPKGEVRRALMAVYPPKAFQGRAKGKEDAILEEDPLDVVEP